jgi:hypothetical protein
MSRAGRNIPAKHAAARRFRELGRVIPEIGEASRVIPVGGKQE